MSPADEKRTVILVIEDDEAIGDVIKIALCDELDCHVTRFTHGNEALREIQSLDPVLMLIDYQLPSMSGLQFFDRVQHMGELKQVPTIMMSANLPWGELEKRHIIGLQKPFDLDDLLRVVKEMLQLQATEEQSGPH